MQDGSVHNNNYVAVLALTIVLTSRCIWIKFKEGNKQWRRKAGNLLLRERQRSAMR